MVQAITVQVGQCGNQIGCRFWDLALREHASCNRAGIYDEAMSTFFRNVDTRYREPLNIPVGDGKSRICSLKARSILVDMEEGVVNQLLQGPLRELFDTQQRITDNSGSGNNWAQGYSVYGPQYRESLMEKVRFELQTCDAPSSFFILHSLGGGTGSGLGSYICELLADEYPDVYRFSTAIFPSGDDDVITSPYNSLLALSKLTEFVDCVLPIDNQALLDICSRYASATGTSSSSSNSSSTPSLPPANSTASLTTNSVVSSSLSSLPGGSTRLAALKAAQKSSHPFEMMNNIVANLLLNLTSSMRFEGSLNMDINEITTNLVPFPRMHFLVSSLTPLYHLADMRLPPRRLDQMFTDAFSKEYQLIKADPKSNLYLACALVVRGNVEITDVRRNIERMRSTLNFINWNREGWKTGHCSMAPVGQPYSLLTLANNTCIKSTFSWMKDRFVKLYRRKAHVHHYTSIFDGTEPMDAALEDVNQLIEQYNEVERNHKTVTSEGLSSKMNYAASSAVTV